jgi:myo-inositol-1-phosphate synthase
MGKVRIAIAGVGNCASSLVQGLEYYKDADDGARVPGLMHVRFGPYHISDVEVVAAFDVDAKKVGCDVADAINASENNTIKFAEVPPTGVTVQRGPTFDGLGEYYREIITESDEPAVDVAQALRESGADVLVCYLPVGSEQADRYYAQCAIDAHVAFVNALPVFIASDPQWAAKFTEAGVPIIGDDIKSQVGATITHRVLAKLFEDRGVELLRTYQLNFGGNMDFMNMLERKRLQSKKISKTQAVTSQIPHEMERAAVHIGPSDHVPWLEDRKMAYVRLEGRAFGDVPLSLEYKLEVWDSPNSAGVIIDAVRAAKIALDRGIAGPVTSASSYFMKSPPEQYGDDVCRDLVEKFIHGEVARWRFTRPVLGVARQRATSPRMNFSTRSRHTSSPYCSGGDFMKYELADVTGPPMPRSAAILAARTASMITPAELGESQTSSLYSRLSGTSPNARPSSRTYAILRSSSHGT